MEEKELIELLREDNIVNLETAKDLKEKGYWKPTYFYYQDKDLPYSPKGLKRVKISDKPINHNKTDDFIYSAPTITEAMDYIIGTGIKYQNSIIMYLGGGNEQL